ncbi:UTP--glucose-1-phosphate uridylyltransferase GalU [Magnetococcales bacterium HHB-1]
MIDVRTAVFPVGGWGTRFLPATKAMPKEMLPVGDKPLIQHAVEEAREAGIEKLVFVTSRGKNAIEDHFDRSLELEQILKKSNKIDSLNVLKDAFPGTGKAVFIRQDEAKGLGHAVWCARHVVGDEPFAVLLPDDWIQPKPDQKKTLQQMIDHLDHPQNAMVAAMEVPTTEISRYGVIDPLSETESLIQIKGLVEKPDPKEAPSNLAIVGRYILPGSIFQLLENQQAGAGGEIQLTDAIMRLTEQANVYGYRFSGRRLDCGHPLGFQMANAAYTLASSDMQAAFQTFLQHEIDHPWSKA